MFVTHWGRDKMTAILQKTFWIFCLNIFFIGFKCSWNFFPRLWTAICEHWFRSWLGANRGIITWSNFIPLFVLITWHGSSFKVIFLYNVYKCISLFYVYKHVRRHGVTYMLHVWCLQLPYFIHRNGLTRSIQHHYFPRRVVYSVQTTGSI